MKLPLRLDEEILVVVDAAGETVFSGYVGTTERWNQAQARTQPPPADRGRQLHGAPDRRWHGEPGPPVRRRSAAALARTGNRTRLGPDGARPMTPIPLRHVLDNLKKGNQTMKKEEPPKEQKTIGEAIETTAAATEPTPAPEQPEAPAPVQEAVAGAVPAVIDDNPMRSVDKAPPSGLRARVGQMPVGSLGVHLVDIDSLWRFSKMVAASGLAPKGLEKIEAIAVAIQLGLEVGLSPMSALQNIAPINGRPGIFGDAAKALVEASGLMEDFDEWYEHDGQRVALFPAAPKDETAAYCLSKRNGRRERVTAFSVGDAKKAGLWGKAGPWSQYPGRMLMWRARGFNLRDNFGDVLKGLRTQEELQDIGDMTEIEDGPIEMPRRASESAAPVTTETPQA